MQALYQMMMSPSLQLVVGYIYSGHGICLLVHYVLHSKPVCNWCGVKHVHCAGLGASGLLKSKHVCMPNSSSNCLVEGNEVAT